MKMVVVPKLKWNHLASILALLLFNELIFETWQQTQTNNPSDTNDQLKEEIQFIYGQGDVHHIVKRGKIKLGRAFGFDKKTKYSKQKNPYPKQPAYNPNYHPGGASNPSYPKQPPHNPNYFGGNSNPVGPPPPYPGINNRYQQSNYPQPGYNYGYKKPGTFGNTFDSHSGSNPWGTQMNHFGNTGFGNFGRKKGLGIGRTIGSAGFGALAGTALGAYGGYKLGKMVGSLGRSGYFGYYNDEGRYIKCSPPSTIKVDPETNISYIPLEEDYDKRCSYFDRPPPLRIEPSMLSSAATIANKINFSMLILFLVTMLQKFWTFKYLI